MANRSLRKVVGLGAASLLAVGASSVYASGFQNYDWSASSLGRAHAGTGVAAEDASTAWTNPAAIPLVGDERQIMGAATGIFGRFDFDFVQGTGNGGAPLVGDDIGDTSDDPAKLAMIPAFHYIMPLDMYHEDLFFGLSINVPFGLATDYDTNSVQRYLATESELLSFDINPSLGFQVNDWLSIGGGVSVQYARARLEKAINAAVVCLQALNNAACDPVGLGNDDTNKLENDFRAELYGDDWSYGWNAGLVLTPTDNTRFGLTYRASIKHNLDGSADFSGDGIDKLNDLNPAIVQGAGLVKQNIMANLNLPEITKFSAMWSATDWLDLFADIAYTRWSKFKELKVVTTTRGTQITPQEYRDTWRFSVGTNMHCGDNWVFRLGYMYDESPIRNAERTARLPGSARQWATTGLRWTSDDQVYAVNVGYAHVFFEEGTPLNEVDNLNAATLLPATAATLVGSYRGAADLFGVDFTMNLP